MFVVILIVFNYRYYSSLRGPEERGTFMICECLIQTLISYLSNCKLIMIVNALLHVCPNKDWYVKKNPKRKVLVKKLLIWESNYVLNWVENRWFCPDSPKIHKYKMCSVPGRPPFLPLARQRVSYILGLTALRQAFFMGYE